MDVNYPYPLLLLLEIFHIFQERMMVSMATILFDTLYQVQKKYVGYVEKASNVNLDSMTGNPGNKNYTRFARDYKKYTGTDLQAQPWCMMMQSTNLVEAFGLDAAKKLLGGDLFASCTMCVNSMKKIGKFTSNKNAVKPGYLIFFKDSDGTPGHVGWVYKVDSTRVYTIEGNTSVMAGHQTVVANGGCCAERWYYKTYTKIYGYGIINYDTPQEPVKEVKKNGWLQENKKWYYYTNNVLSKNKWILSADKKDWYWMKSDGTMAENEWIQDTKKNWYFIDIGGKAHRGWYQDKDKNWYYLNEKENSYGSDCQMLTGFVKITYKNQPTIFYLEEKSNGTRGKCYMNTTAQINGKWYKFDDVGRCLNPNGSNTKI